MVWKRRGPPRRASWRRVVPGALALAVLWACAPPPGDEWRPSREGDEVAIQVALLEGVLQSTSLYTSARGIHTVCLAPVRVRGVRWDGDRLRPESHEAAPATERLLGLIRVPYREVVPFYDCHRGGEGGWEVFHDDGEPAVLVYASPWEYQTDERVEASVVVQRSRRDRLRFTCLLDRSGRRWEVGPCTCSAPTPGPCERVGSVP